MWLYFRKKIQRVTKKARHAFIFENTFKWEKDKKTIVVVILLLGNNPKKDRKGTVQPFVLTNHPEIGRTYRVAMSEPYISLWIGIDAPTVHDYPFVILILIREFDIPETRWHRRRRVVIAVPRCIINQVSNDNSLYWVGLAM